MTTTRTIYIKITIEGDYYKDDAAAEEWARRLMSRICDLWMSSAINTMDYTITE